MKLLEIFEGCGLVHSENEETKKSFKMNPRSKEDEKIRTQLLLKKQKEKKAKTTRKFTFNPPEEEK